MRAAPVAMVLPEPPTDGITALEYLQSSGNDNSSSLLACSSWDGSLRLHDTSRADASKGDSSPCHKATHKMASGPLLCLSTTSSVNGTGSSVLTGGLNGMIKQFQPETGAISTIGQHLGNGLDNKVACSCLQAWKSNPNIAFSAGWDARFHVWDIRMSSSSSSSKPSAATTINLPAKAFAMDTTISNDNDNHACTVAVATANRRVCILDLRAAAESENAIKVAIAQDRESSLKYQTRTISFFPNGTGFALGSIEGRVAIEYLKEAEAEQAGKKRYAFKCHRVGDIIYPVNAIAFHPKFGTFATGGADGTVVFWDAQNKKRLTSLANFASTSVAALAFNYDGTELAVASSYTFEDGEREHPRDEIFVRKVLDEEIQPKLKCG